MSDPIVVLDAGVVDQVVVQQEFRWVLRELVEDGWVPIIPTVTLAAAITGRPTDAPVNQAVKRIGCTDTPEATARLAGHLRFEVERSGHRRRPSGIDAIMAAHAAESGTGVVFTTDLADVTRPPRAEERRGLTGRGFTPFRLAGSIDSRWRRSRGRRGTAIWGRPHSGSQLLLL